MRPHIQGFLSSPKADPSGQVYRGRFACLDVQWTGVSTDAILTFTVTAEQIADACETRLLWTDQDVQRGILPGQDSPSPRELPLADGYPDPTKYVFDAANADDMVEKLLAGERLFLSPLVWNLRPGTFTAFWNEAGRELYIYEAKVFLPDSHHRQQAILKAVRTSRDAPASFPKFNPERQFKVEIYFLTAEDEGNYFFDKNQRPRPTAKSKAYDISTYDDLSLLAKRVIQHSEALTDNVNRVTDRLTAKNPQVITLSTLREMMKSVAPDDYVDSAELDGLARVAAEFYDLLAEIRPELGRLPATERRRTRTTLIVDAAVMMHGYAQLIRDYNRDIAAKGRTKAYAQWTKKLQLLSSSNSYTFDQWTGDFFAKLNPLWHRVGVVKPSTDPHRFTTLNTGAARSQCGKALTRLLEHPRPISDISFLVAR